MGRCPSGKREWTSRAKAKEQIKDMRSRGKPTKNLRAYKCVLCDSFHIGHQTIDRETLRIFTLKKYA